MELDRVSKCDLLEGKPPLLYVLGLPESFPQQSQAIPSLLSLSTEDCLYLNIEDVRNISKLYVIKSNSSEFQFLLRLG